MCLGELPLDGYREEVGESVPLPLQLRHGSDAALQAAATLHRSASGPPVQLADRLPPCCRKGAGGERSHQLGAFRRRAGLVQHGRRQRPLRRMPLPG